MRYTFDNMPDLTIEPPEYEPRPSDDREPPDGWPTEDESDAAGDEYEAKLDRQADTRERCNQ